MTKIMLVEDDKSLREIYGVRLLAEGYDIVSAGDGEEALAMAIKERPVLIVTDVMMPRISGFDMLDILRSTTETKNIKVIMMTALSSEDQRKHGEQLGADRYLVKSQVGIEDVVRVVHEVLGDSPAPTAPAPAAATATPQNPVSAAVPAQPAAPVQLQRPTVAPPRPAAPAAAMPPQVDPMVRPAPAPASTMHAPLPPSSAPAAPSTRQRVIQPINDPTTKIDINNLLDKELAREAGVDVNSRPNVATTAEERAIIENQLRNTIPAAPVPQQPAPTPQPTPAVITEPEPAPPIPQRPPVQPPQRPNVAPMQPRQDSVPPTQ
jgi:CheY-like chemotaxis protein